MTKQFIYGSLAGLALLAGCAAVRPADDVPSVPKSQTVAEADRKLARVARERAQAEAGFAASEQLCHAKFLVNNCLDKASEKRRATLAQLRAVEIEAEYFKRKFAVDERDRALAEGEKTYAAEGARLAAEPALSQAAVEASPKKPAAPADRKAEHAAKLKQREAEQQADAAQRTANVAAFEKRKRESEQRQRKIAEKKKAAVSEGEGR